MARALSEYGNIKTDFDRDGYVVLRGFLSHEEVADVNQNLDRFIREIVPTLPQQTIFYEQKGKPETIKQFGDLTTRDPYFQRLLDTAGMEEVAEAVLGGEVTSRNLQWFNKPPMIGKCTPPHQDGYYFMLEPNEAVTMWLALDNVDANNGCMRYIRGSHKTGMRPHGRTSTLGFSQGIMNYGCADLEQEVAIFAQPGDLLVHHSLTIHRADANISDRHRPALGQVFYAAWAKEDRAGQHAYMEKLLKDLAATGKV